jgi:hypothetical protein
MEIIIPTVATLQQIFRIIMDNLKFKLKCHLSEKLFCCFLFIFIYIVRRAQKSLFQEGTTVTPDQNDHVSGQYSRCYYINDYYYYYLDLE